MLCVNSCNLECLKQGASSKVKYNASELDWFGVFFGGEAFQSKPDGLFTL